MSLLLSKQTTKALLHAIWNLLVPAKNSPVLIHLIIKDYRVQFYPQINRIYLQSSARSQHKAHQLWFEHLLCFESCNFSALWVNYRNQVSQSPHYRNQMDLVYQNGCVISLFWGFSQSWNAPWQRNQELKKWFGNVHLKLTITSLNSISTSVFVNNSKNDKRLHDFSHSLFKYFLKAQHYF